jgi:hypothetical protein
MEASPKRGKKTVEIGELSEKGLDPRLDIMRKPRDHSFSQLPVRIKEIKRS